MIKNKKIIIFITTILGVFLLTSCKKTVDPKEAMESYIDNVIYNKETKQDPENYFSDLKMSSAEDLNKETTLLLAEILDIDEEYTQEINKLNEVLTSNLEEKTKYEINVTDESKNKVEITAAINGLTALNEQELDEIIDENIKEIDDELTDKTSEEEVKKLSAELGLSSLIMWIQTQEVENEITKVETTLIVDPKDKTKWIIEDELKFYENFVEALNLY